MKKKEDCIHEIRRNYRIKPSKELQDFWAEIKDKKLQDDYISFHFFKLKLLTLEQVAEFNYKKIRFWFKTKGEHFLVRYYIPIAITATFSNTLFIAAYDHAKRFIGIFLSNLNEDPIFITSDLSSLLENISPTISKEAFLKTQVSSAVMKGFDFDKSYLDSEGVEHPELFYQEVLELLKFIQIIYTSIDTNFELKIKSLKKSFKIYFSSKNPRLQEVKQEIEIPKLEYYSNSIDLIIATLNRINFQWWSGSSSMRKEYGFYRIDTGIAMLHIHQLCEFLRFGAIPHHHNVHFPSIVYSTHPSGYEDALEYEIVLFETQEEYSAYYKAFNAHRRKLSVQRLEEKNIPMIVNYFLDAPEKQLAIDGFDKMKIPFEEQLISDLQLAIAAEDSKKKQFNVILEKGGKTYGHCYVERFNEQGEAYFYFYDWNGFFKNEEVIDGLINKAIQLILQTYPLKTIYAEPTKGDTYRNEVFKRAGFEFVKEEHHIRDSFSSNQPFNLWKLDCNTFSTLTI